MYLSAEDESSPQPPLQALSREDAKKRRTQRLQERSNTQRVSGRGRRYETNVMITEYVTMMRSMFHDL